MREVGTGVAPLDAANPLLELEPPLAFDLIEARHLRPAIDELVRRARLAIDAIVGQAPRTYAGTLAALDDAIEPLLRAMTVVEHLESVATCEALRKAYQEVLPRVTAFLSSIPLHAGLHAALRETAAAEGDGDGLTPTQRRHLLKTLADFRRHGAELPEEGKQRLAAIDVALGELTLRYAQNVLDATSAFELVIEDEAELAGLPPSAIDAARASARASGRAGFRFTLQGPSYAALMTYLDHAGHRERVWRAFNTRACAAPWDNRPLVIEILRLRREKARLLGFRDFADLVLEDRMVETGARARAFVDDLRARARAGFVAESASLLAFRREVEGPAAPPLEPWDVAHWAEKQRRARFELDEEALRPYFPLPRVLEGIFELLERLYGVRVEAASLPTWHASVRAYHMTDEDGTALGSFYVDAHPRPTKRGGAWMNGLVTGRPGPHGPAGARGWSPHVAVVCANLTEPVGDAPALLTHREVETVFHEVGHLVHHMLSRVEVPSLGGTNVAWDFVELPSQIMENWCWERESLEHLARHHETGRPLPAPLIDRLCSARPHRAASAMMRQLGLATVDLVLHVDVDPTHEPDVLGRARAVQSEHAAAPLPHDYAMIASFGHLFAHPVGYAAGYYSYAWAEVLDADAFTRLSAEGPWSREAGRRFRAAILAQGNSRAPMELYVELMGREPSIEPLLRRSGLA